MQEIKVERPKIRSRSLRTNQKLGFGKFSPTTCTSWNTTLKRAGIIPGSNPTTLSLWNPPPWFSLWPEMFEGMKAYKTEGRPYPVVPTGQNIERANNSNCCLCIPEIPAEDFLNGLKKLVEVDQTDSHSARYVLIYPSVCHCNRSFPWVCVRRIPIFL